MTETYKGPAETFPRRTPAVLVVDDEADLRELLALALVRLGLDVDTAESVGAGRARLAQAVLALRAYHANNAPDFPAPRRPGRIPVKQMHPHGWCAFCARDAPREHHHS